MSAPISDLIWSAGSIQEPHGLVILTCSVMVRRPRLERRDWDGREDGRTRKRGTIKPIQARQARQQAPTSERNKGTILGPKKKNVSVQNKRPNWRGAHLSLSYGMSSCHCLLFFPLSHATADQKAAFGQFLLVET